MKFSVDSNTVSYFIVLLVTSREDKDYSYRVNDNENVERIKIILLLRKLRVFLKDIALIFQSNSRVRMLQTLQMRIAEMEEEIYFCVTMN